MFLAPFETRRRAFAAEDGVDVGLVAIALGFEPVKDIGVDAGCDLALDWSVKFAALGMLPLLLGEGRDVAVVDLALGTGSEGFRLATWAGVRGIANNLVFIDRVPSGLARLADNSNYFLGVVVFANGVSHDDEEYAANEAEGLPAFLSVLYAILDGNVEGIAKDLACFLKA